MSMNLSAASLRSAAAGYGDVRCTGEKRWTRMKAFVASCILSLALAAAASAEITAAIRPAEYTLVDVTIVLTHTYYAYGTKYTDFTQISGSGETLFRRDDTGNKVEKHFTLDSKHVVEFLRGLYRVHFFDLKETYIDKPGVEIGEDGTISEYTTSSNHTWNTTVTIHLQQYEKSVRYNNFASVPTDLKDLVNTLEEHLEGYLPKRASK
jgi:hypothetical protein